MDPVWDEIHQFKVYDREFESLTMMAYDRDFMQGGDSKIGTVIMPLATLDEGIVRSFDAEVMVGEGSGG